MICCAMIRCGLFASLNVRRSRRRLSWLSSKQRGQSLLRVRVRECENNWYSLQNKILFGSNPHHGRLYQSQTTKASKVSSHHTHQPIEEKRRNQKVTSRLFVIFLEEPFQNNEYAALELQEMPPLQLDQQPVPPTPSQCIHPSIPAKTPFRVNQSHEPFLFRLRRRRRKNRKNTNSGIS
jgi:hypothetical protein